MKDTSHRLFAGFSQVSYEGEPYDLGHGVTFRSVYAHLFAAPMVAFARAPKGEPHPPPWRAARGGFAWDIEAELAVPAADELPGGHTAKEIALLIASLLRLARHAYLTVPVISDHPFDEAATANEAPVLRPLETGLRIISSGSEELAQIRREDLEWVRLVWPKSAMLLKQDRRFGDALSAADACTVAGRTASALLLAWGALEELFAPASRSEIRYRVSANIAAYLEPVGAGRLALFREVRELYDARSAVAHSAREAEVADLLRTYVVLRNALTKIVVQARIPTTEDFQNALFAGA